MWLMFLFLAVIVVSVIAIMSGRINAHEVEEIGVRVFTIPIIVVGLIIMLFGLAR